MKLKRRALITSFFAAGAVLATPRWLLAARPDAAFDARQLDAAVANVFEGPVIETDQIMLKIPDIAENGAVVPVTISTDLPNVESIAVVVEKNPTPLAAMFELTEKSVPEVSVRIKMGETSPVHVLVRSGGKVFSTSKEVKVTIGGCGG